MKVNKITWDDSVSGRMVVSFPKTETIEGWKHLEEKWAVQLDIEFEVATEYRRRVVYGKLDR